MSTIDTLLDNRGTPLEKQTFTWREMASRPISKLDDDAFTRVRVILMNGVEPMRCASSTSGRVFTKNCNCPWRRSAASNSTR